jgi:cytochrome P450
VCHINAAANRDPLAFEDPELLDVVRPNAKEHIGFGYGAHYCLGQALARLEGRIFFETMTRRFPELRLAADEFEWTGNAEFRSLVRLPVILGAERAS